MTVRGVLLDRDGVLIDFDVAAIRQALEPVCGMSLAQLRTEMEAYGAASGFPHTAADEQRFWRNFCAELGARWGRTEAEIRRLQAFDLYQYVTLFEDALPALKELHAGGIKIGVLSNNPMSSILTPLARHGLSGLITVACGALIAGHAKPHPSAYRSALKALEVSPAECLYLDDEAECVAGARAVGMASYLVDRRRAAHDLEACIVRDLSLVPALVDPLRDLARTA